MTVLFLVVPLAILASLAAVVAFAWSVDSGQLDDLETPALRMLEGSEPESLAKASGAPEVPHPPRDARPSAR